jgi:ergothioneine biosynthesis protein EgtB
MTSHLTADITPLAQHYAQVRATTERLAAPLSPEDCQVQSMPDASPTKWHLAHVTWFFETFILERFERDFRPFDASFRVLFNSYYQGVGEQYPRPARGLVTRPDLANVYAYRASVDERMQSVLQHIDDPALTELVTLGLHHEQQHQELLLTDIQHALSFNPAQPAYRSAPHATGVQSQAMRWVEHAGGVVEIGHDVARNAGFAFDNEGPRHKTLLQPFALGSRPVSNAEYLEFMRDGGYQRAELWLSLGWDWLRNGARNAPLYWREVNGRRRRFSLHGEAGLDPHAPVCHLSYFEADAYARWAGARLPTEAEWEAMAQTLPAEALAGGHFADAERLHPTPSPDGGTPYPSQMFGSVWEWTQSSYTPYPGFRPAPGAVGEYNGKFMCQQLVLRGGSCATPPGHVRASYRNFFPPEAQWQFSGLRLARDLS